MPELIPPSLSRELAEYATRLRRHFGARLRTVCLFGSWARGDAHEGSDIDVAVVVEGLTVEEWRVARRLASDVAVDLGAEPLSPLILSGAQFDEMVHDERRLVRDIATQGIPL